MYQGYAAFGGLEIVNSERAYALARAAGAGFFKNPKQPQLAEVLAEIFEDSGYVVNFADPTQAPWYDPSQHELSTRFLGVYGVRLDNTAGSTRQVSVTENSGNGGVIGAPRKGTRAVVARAGVLAKGTDALEYGRAWLAAALELAGCEQGGDCDRADVFYWSSPPADGDESDRLSRYLKYTAATTLPFIVEEAEHRGFYYQLVEWNWTSEKPSIYGADRGIDLELATSLALVQDAPINFVKYPAAALEETVVGYTRPTIATNVVLNPSLESAATGWAALATQTSGTAPTGYFTSGLSGAASAFGTKSLELKIAGAGSGATLTGTSQLQATATIPLASVPVDRTILHVGLWAETVVIAGPGTVTAPTAILRFFNASNVQQGADFALLPDTSGAGLFRRPQTSAFARPATATYATVTVTADVAGWSTGNADALNSDIRMLIDGLTVAYVGSV